MNLSDLPLRRLLILAFVAMCAQDVLATAMVIAESHRVALAAGSLDVAQWILALLTSGLAIEEIVRHGWWTRRALAIIGAVSAANFTGTVLGVLMASGIGR